MDKVRKILDDCLVNNDSNITDIIFEYAYATCVECKEFNQVMLSFLKDKKICLDCSIKNKYRKCQSCEIIFDPVQSEYCDSCKRNCLIFCSECPIRQINLINLN